MSKIKLFIDGKEFNRGENTNGNENIYKIIDQEIDKGSITPRTFRSRSFEKSSQYLQFKDEYGYDENKVILFGINEGRFSEEIYRKMDMKVCEVSKLDASSTNTKNYKDDMTGDVEHTSLEKELMLKSLKYLLEEGNSTVLLDIFAREKSSLIKVSKETFVKTHTVLLYKNPKSEISSSSKNPTEIVVIDPNNFIYSSHLKHITRDKEIFGSLNEKYPFEIKTKHATLIIYKSVTEKHRDCTDIGVKIALWLNTQKNEHIDLDKIKDLPIVKLLTNQSAISEFSIEEQLPQKIKQASSLEVVKKFCDIEKHIYSILNGLRKIDQNKYNKIAQDHEDQLTKFDTGKYSDTLLQLAQFSSNCVQEYKNCIDEFKTNLDENYTIFSTANITLTGNINIINEDFYEN